jgi:hypothetical protein
MTQFHPFVFQNEKLTQEHLNYVGIKAISIQNSDCSFKPSAKALASHEPRQLHQYVNSIQDLLYQEGSCLHEKLFYKTASSIHKPTVNCLAMVQLDDAHTEFPDFEKNSAFTQLYHCTSVSDYQNANNLRQTP